MEDMERISFRKSSRRKRRLMRKKRLESTYQEIDRLRDLIGRRSIYTNCLEKTQDELVSALNSIASITVFLDTAEVYEFALEQATTLAAEALERVGWDSGCEPVLQDPWHMPEEEG